MVEACLALVTILYLIELRSRKHLEKRNESLTRWNTYYKMTLHSRYGWSIE